MRFCSKMLTINTLIHNLKFIIHNLTKCCYKEAAHLLNVTAKLRYEAVAVSRKQ